MGFILYILLFIIIFIVLIFGLGISILRGIINFFTGGNKNRTSSQQNNGNPFYENQSDTNTQSTNNNSEKVFNKNEGEYVDFEEYTSDEN